MKPTSANVEEDNEFFATIDTISADRHPHIPRTLKQIDEYGIYLLATNA